MSKFVAVTNDELVFFDLPNDQLLTTLTMTVDTVDVLPIDKHAASRFIATVFEV